MCHIITVELPTNAIMKLYAIWNAEAWIAKPWNYKIILVALEKCFESKINWCAFGYNLFEMRLPSTRLKHEARRRLKWAWTNRRRKKKLLLIKRNHIRSNHILAHGDTDDIRFNRFEIFLAAQTFCECQNNWIRAGQNYSRN